MRAESRAYREEITCAVREALKDAPVVTNKLWIDVFVQKPNHRGDAANVLDLVCDAIKDATHVDDRWYSIQSIDWQIAKHEPMLFIGMGQEAVEDAQACSACGRLLALEAFQKNRAAARGVGRICRECRIGSHVPRPKRQPVEAVRTYTGGIFGDAEPNVAKIVRTNIFGEISLA